MSAYAVGHLRNVRMGPGIITYLQGIDATIEPYQGRFIIHGDRPLVKEGNGTGDLIVIEFPDLEQARAWYQSPEYQAILALRADNSEGEILLINGVSPDHKATDVLSLRTYSYHNS
jgi:uncharacterized protein (DUF1330 family)